MMRVKALVIPFDRDILTVAFLMDWLRRQVRCEACGEVLRLAPEVPGLKGDRSPSIDRVHPERGYVVGNIALLCWRCNNLKRDATSSELQTIVDWMRRMGR